MKRKERMNSETEWVLCSQDWRDIVITYVPELNDIPIEENYAEVSLEEIKDAYLTYGSMRKRQNECIS